MRSRTKKLKKRLPRGGGQLSPCGTIALRALFCNPTRSQNGRYTRPQWTFCRGGRTFRSALLCVANCCHCMTNWSQAVQFSARVRIAPGVSADKVRGTLGCVAFVSREREKRIHLWTCCHEFKTPIGDLKRGAANLPTLARARGRCVSFVSFFLRFFQAANLPLERAGGNVLYANCRTCAAVARAPGVCVPVVPRRSACLLSARACVARRVSAVAVQTNQPTRPTNKKTAKRRRFAVLVCSGFSGFGASFHWLRRAIRA